MTGVDVAALQAERSAAWFVDLTRPSRAALIESVIYALADLQCDLANGDHVDTAAYRDDAAAAVGAVIEHLAWTEPVAALAEAERQRDGALAKIARVEALCDEYERLGAASIPPGMTLSGCVPALSAIPAVTVGAALTDPRPPTSMPYEATPDIRVGPIDPRPWQKISGTSPLKIDSDGRVHRGEDATVLTPSTDLPEASRDELLAESVRLRAELAASTPTAETVPPRVAGTGGPQNRSQGRGSAG